ncbi:MAG: hypothetical protein J6D11_05185 [Clostridia bacterium]|nr:hypothetical protein [Clostridia bacterium]
MSYNPKDLKEELRSYKFEFDVLQKIPCSVKENKEYRKILKDGGQLPEGVYPYIGADGTDTSDFYTICESNLSKDEMDEYLTYRKLKFLKTIKNCVVFFMVLQIITIIGAILISSL